MPLVENSTTPRRLGRWWRRDRARPTVAPAAVRVLFINQYYWPNHASTAQHLTDLAESLADQGIEVHVICSRGGYRPDDQTTANPAFEIHNGVRIHRVAASSLGRRSNLRRMADYLSYYAAAATLAARLPRFDVVVTLTTPPMIGLVGTLLQRLKRSQHVYWSMDLHPDASLALGKMSRGNPLVRLLAWLSDLAYRQADQVVTLGAYMADRIEAKGVPFARLNEIPVWSRADEIDPLPLADHPLREQHGLADKFVVMYSGNLGLAHSFDEFLEAARRLKEREDIVFLFVGDGPRLAEVEAGRSRDELSNIRFLPYFPREVLHASLSMANVHLISMREEMTGIVVPGKLYGVMASSRPALFVGPRHCETADTIRAAGCGRSIPLGDVDALVQSIEELAADRRQAEILGESGRGYFLEHHERAICCASWAELLDSLAGVSRRPGVARPLGSAPSRARATIPAR